NYLHGIAANAYGENAIAPINMSPTSTYFFKIHGLIEYLFDSFQRGDFNHDGHTDIIQRNSVDPGDLYLSWMNGPNLISNNFVANVGHDGCDWQPVAAADMNFDGDNDIIWRGAGCSGISIWYMDGNANMTGFVDSWSGLPTVGGDWTIVGTGDF